MWNIYGTPRGKIGRLWGVRTCPLFCDLGQRTAEFVGQHWWDQTFRYNLHQFTLPYKSHFDGFDPIPWSMKPMSRNFSGWNYIIVVVAWCCLLKFNMEKQALVEKAVKPKITLLVAMLCSQIPSSFFLGFVEPETWMHICLFNMLSTRMFKVEIWMPSNTQTIAITVHIVLHGWLFTEIWQAQETKVLKGYVCRPQPLFLG